MSRQKLRWLLFIEFTDYSRKDPKVSYRKPLIGQILADTWSDEKYNHFYELLVRNDLSYQTRIVAYGDKRGSFLIKPNGEKVNVNDELKELTALCKASREEESNQCEKIQKNSKINNMILILIHFEKYDDEDYEKEVNSPRVISTGSSQGLAESFNQGADVASQRISQLEQTLARTREQLAQAQSLVGSVTRPLSPRAEAQGLSYGRSSPRSTIRPLSSLGSQFYR